MKNRLAALPPRPDELLRTWTGLNAYLLKETDERRLAALLDYEQRARRRAMFMLRIHSRINKLRRTRERAELSDKRAAR